MFVLQIRRESNFPLKIFLEFQIQFIYRSFFLQKVNSTLRLMKTFQISPVVEALRFVIYEKTFCLFHEVLFADLKLKVISFEADPIDSWKLHDLETLVIVVRSPHFNALRKHSFCNPFNKLKWKRCIQPWSNNGKLLASSFFLVITHDDFPPEVFNKFTI